MEQRSKEWFEARCGKVTASRIGDILKTIRNGDYAASRRNYEAQLVTERLTGRTHERFYTNEHMDWGKDQEEHAKAAYEARTGHKVESVGLITHPKLEMAAASPDGLIGEEGLLEIKCLLPANHLELLLTEEIKDDYMLQMLWQMACTGRKWCDFVSYDPSQTEGMQLFIKRVERDDKEINDLECEVNTFLHEVADKVEALKAKFEEKKTSGE